MKRKHRHELKQNEFLVFFEQAVDWLNTYQRQLVTWAGIALAAAVVLGGVYYFVAHRQDEAQRLVNEALDLYHAPIQKSSVVQSAGGTDVKSFRERYEKSLEAFTKVFEGYSGTPQARQARYYAALCHKGLGQLEEAEKLLEEVTSGRRDLLHYLASQALAVVRTEKGDYDAAAELYRLLVADTDNPLPKDILLFNLARVNERAGHLEEARKDYQRVLEDYPNSIVSGEARQRNEMIEYRLNS